MLMIKIINDFSFYFSISMKTNNSLLHNTRQLVIIIFAIEFFSCPFLNTIIKSIKYR